MELEFQTLASAVVQVFLADPPSLNRWNKRCCGVATFIKDNQKRSYFIRVYNLRVKQATFFAFSSSVTTFVLTFLQKPLKKFECFTLVTGLN